MFTPCKMTWWIFLRVIVKERCKFWCGSTYQKICLGCFARMNLTPRRSILRSRCVGLCEDMTDRVPELRHINMSLVAISFSQARKKTTWGMYASLTPLRFENWSANTRSAMDVSWAVQKVVDSSGREMLYILNFYLPRFLEMGFEGKLSTRDPRALAHQPTLRWRSATLRRSLFCS